MKDSYTETGLSRFSFSLTVHADHERKASFLTLWENGRRVREVKYEQAVHYDLLVKCIEAIKGEGCCAVTPDRPDPIKDPEGFAVWFKKEMSNPNYWNRPLHDPYAQKMQQKS